MKYLVSFLGGALVGAVVALLFAPSSGTELRAQIQTGAEAELKKAEAEWQKAMTDLHEKFDQTSQELKTFVEQSRAKEAKEAEAETEPAA
jgi:gas vesicle protein